MVTVTKLFEFEACHHLPYYEGSCHRIHGHSYKLEVTVSGSVLKSGEKQGMIMDFKDLKSIVKEVVVDKYDHENLNDFFPNPTAEIMVKSIAMDIISRLPKNVFLVSCKLWETSSSYAEWDVQLATLKDTMKDILLDEIKQGLALATPILQPLA